MRIHCLTIIPTLLLASCALESEKQKDKPAPAPEPEKVVEETPEPLEMGPPKPEDPGLEFAIPDPTTELMTDEKKKTVSGPIPIPKDDPAVEEEESVINVEPPSLPPSVPPVVAPEED